MTVTINGSTGISSPGGDTSTSLSTGLLTVTGSTVPVDGMYLPTTNTLAWATNSTERLRLDASGNLGLGVTPSAWLIYKAFDIGPYSSLSAAGAEVEVNSNAAYLAGTGWTYKQTGLASQYRQTVGQHRWYTATSGTAGNAISFTQAMTLDASGNLGIGTTSPESRLHVAGRIRLSTNPADPTDSAASLYDGNGVGPTLSGLSVAFRTGNTPTERARIDSSGNLLVGKTVADDSTTGFRVAPGSCYMSMARASAAPCYFNRTGTDGTVVEIANDSVTVGTISVSGSNTAYNTSSDQRLKENIVDAPSAIDSINAIKVRSFNWKADGSYTDYGYIAQELLEVVPEAVAVSTDPDEMMGVDFGRLTPRLVKAIQELTARLEALEGAK